ncbi:TetR/AcrR family transcriptional regulator [Streptomyces sp. NPDC090075]|uniref:TetR/AcrR family transcriptional regulator n=1 Tax=unclassified Streptomyces TaxID=2593676 RepID=UPI0037F3DC62
MPKIVDPEERRREVVEAVFRVVARGGIQQATLQHVAAEAGLAIGSVRHYFDSHSELLAAAAREMVRRVAARVQEKLEQPPAADPHRLVEEIAGQFLPLDPARADETAVWLEFAVAARTNRALRPTAAELHEGLRDVAARLLRRLGVTDPVAAEHLAAVIDGLALDAALQPDRLRPDTVRAVLRRHLAQLPAVQQDGRTDTP